jgi:hypothetical protein
MKKELSPASIALALGVIAVVVVAVGIAIFKPSFGPGPVVKPRPFQPPAGYRAPQPGAPIGAPAGTKPGK